MAFQLIDDNIDYSDVSGKDYGKDLKEGLINFPTLQLLSLYPELFYPVYQLRSKNFQHVPWTHGQMKAAIEKTREMANTLLIQAEQLLHNIIKHNPGKVNQSLVPEFDHLLELVKKREK